MSATTNLALKHSRWDDYIQLTKPRITLFCLLMTLGGVAMAPDRISFVQLLLTLIGTSFSVGAANTLNMWWERDTDKLMKRTALRPLPAGRLPANAALVFAYVLGVSSVVVLGLGVNWTSAMLSLFAMLSYVFVYTPMKRVTPHALLIGAVPGAMPPLIGWTAVTGSITLPGVILFAILLIWQIPHFIAISVNHSRDYAAAGIKTWPGDRGLHSATVQATVYSVLLVPVSLLLPQVGVAGTFYSCVAAALGLWMLVLSTRGFNPVKHTRWATQLFVASLVYLPALTVGLAIDVLLFK